MITLLSVILKLSLEAVTTLLVKKWAILNRLFTSHYVSIPCCGNVSRTLLSKDDSRGDLSLPDNGSCSGSISCGDTESGPDSLHTAFDLGGSIPNFYSDPQIWRL